MREYLDVLRLILETGVRSDDRTGTGTLSLFGPQYRVDLAKGFPILTTKKLPLRVIAVELLWFLSGGTHVKWLQDRNVHIWDEWATKEQCARFEREEGDFGPVYGHQWRDFGLDYGGGPCDDGFDQISWVVAEIKKNPNSRRLIVSAWNPKDADRVALPPCHTLFQFYVRQGKLSCHLYQRSADFFLGVPFNLASYALLIHMVAHVSNLEVGSFIHTFGDAHIYLNHLDQVHEQLSRGTKDLPKLVMEDSARTLWEFTEDCFHLDGYDPHPAIKAPIAV